MYEVEETVQPLPFDVRYDIQTRAVCASDVASSRVDGNVTTGTITQSYNITLTQNGQTITEIPEGESATLTLTLDDASAVFDVNTDLVLGFLFTGNFSVTPNIPAIQIAEIQVSPPSDGSQGERTGAQTLLAGERSLSYTIRAIQDNLTHDAAPDDNEHPLEATAITVVYPSEPAERIRVGGTRNWVHYINIRDGVPPVATAIATPIVTPVATTIANPNLAMGTVTITDSTPLNDPELGDTLTASTVAADLDGLTSPTFSYEWLRNGTAIVGTGATYDVTVADIGSTLEARAHFMDDLLNAETLTSAATAEVPSGPVIRAPNGYLWDDNAATDDTITVDTSVMGYTYVHTTASMFTYQWVYVDANGLGASPATVPADMQEYTLTMADDMKYLQVEVEFTDGNGDSVTKRANMQTRLITERPPLEIPTDVTATVARQGGSVALSWGLTSLGGQNPSGFDTATSRRRWQTQNSQPGLRRLAA